MVTSIFRCQDIGTLLTGGAGGWTPFGGCCALAGNGNTAGVPGAGVEVRMTWRIGVIIKGFQASRLGTSLVTGGGLLGSAGKTTGALGGARALGAGDVAKTAPDGAICILPGTGGTRLIAGGSQSLGTPS